MKNPHALTARLFYGSCSKVTSSTGIISSSKLMAFKCFVFFHILRNNDFSLNLIFKILDFWRHLFNSLIKSFHSHNFNVLELDEDGVVEWILAHFTRVLFIFNEIRARGFCKSPKWLKYFGEFQSLCTPPTSRRNILGLGDKIIYFCGMSHALYLIVIILLSLLRIVLFSK